MSKIMMARLDDGDGMRITNESFVKNLILFFLTLVAEVTTHQN